MALIEASPTMALRTALMQVALGEMPAELVITGGTVVNVLSAELHPADVLIHGGHVAALLPPGSYDAGTAPVLDATGRYLVPGLIDPHMHMESSGVTPAEFARGVVPRGVTTVAIDPHEFGNVVGMQGIRTFLDAARDLPLRVLLRVPSRVPELPEALEGSGCTISNAETEEMLGWPEAVCLAGDINPQIILRRDPAQMWRLDRTLAAGKVVSGYVPQLAPTEVAAMVAAGVGDSHVPKTVDELLSNVRAGLHVLLTPRPGRFEAADFARLGRLLREGRVDGRRMSLCTDDVLTHELLAHGHLDLRLRMLLDGGTPPATAVQMATLNTATLLGVADRIGAIAPGRLADILLVSDLAGFKVEQVLLGGRLVAEAGALVREPAAFVWPDSLRHTIHCTVPDLAADLALKAPAGAKSARCRVLALTHPKSLTECDLPVAGGLVQPDPSQDVLSVAVLERYHGTGRIGRGFVRGLDLRRGAIACSINHNSHHIFAVGASHADMQLALRRLIELQGGFVSALAGSIVAEMPLPIIGMIAEGSLSEVADRLSRFEAATFAALADTVGARPLYALAFLCSPVVMNYGLTDKGLVDNRAMCLLDIVATAASHPATQSEPVS